MTCWISTCAFVVGGGLGCLEEGGSRNAGKREGNPSPLLKRLAAANPLERPDRQCTARSQRRERAKRRTRREHALWNSACRSFRLETTRDALDRTPNTHPTLPQAPPTFIPRLQRERQSQLCPAPSRPFRLSTLQQPARPTTSPATPEGSPQRLSSSVPLPLPTLSTLPRVGKS